MRAIVRCPTNDRVGNLSPVAVLAAALVALVALVLTSCGGDDGRNADPARFCAINGEIEQLEDFSTASPADARELVDRTRELLAEAEQTSPDEIANEVNATADAFRELLDFYEEADFDVGPAEFEAAILSGAIGSDPPEAETVFAWVDRNCGL